MFFFQKGASMFGGCREQPTDAIYVWLEREGNFQLLKYLEVLTKSIFFWSSGHHPDSWV